MKKTTPVLGLLFVILNSITLAQVNPDNIDAWKEFNSRYNNQWVIRWDEKTGTPASLYMGKSEPLQGTPEQMARTFLSQNRIMFGMPTGLTDLQPKKILTVNGEHHVTFQQTFSGILVEDAEYKVHILSDGRVHMANGTYYRTIQASVQPTLGEDRALAFAMDDLGGAVELRREVMSSVVIFPKDDVFLLAWKFLIAAQSPFGSWQYVIDANNGNVLQKQNLVASADGEGNVYPKHPNNSSVTQVLVPRLDGSGYLRGTYADILTYDLGGRAYDDVLYFVYNPSDPHFDEANVYYHIDKYRSTYLANLGFTGLGQVTAYVHGTLFGQGGAYFDHLDGKLYFGHGDGVETFDHAKEDKVIYHEYTHATIYSIQPELGGGFNEEGAIYEGTPDYFAGSFTGRPKILDYAKPGSQRDMANPAISTYSQYQSEFPVDPYVGGQFWSACLWALRDSIGQTVADKLAFDALYYITSNPTFLTYREVIIARDQATYGGAHIQYIKCVFSSRGIGDAPVTTSGSLACNENWTGTVNISAGVTVPSGVSLTVQPGATVSFPANASLTINGKLTAVGTSTNKIRFQGTNWTGIVFEDPSDNTSQVSYSIISSAVYGIRCNSANPTITWNEISGNQYGIHLVNASPQISYNHIRQNVGSPGGSSGTGIYVWGSGSSPDIRNNRIYENTHGVQLVGVDYGSNVYDNDIYDNHYNLFARDYSAPPYTWFGSYNNFYWPVGPAWWDVRLQNNVFLAAHDNWWGENPPNTGQFDIDPSSDLDYWPYLTSQVGHGLPKGGFLPPQPKATTQNLLREYRLFQNYPNPFNPQTIIRYVLPEAGEVRLRVYNVLGSVVRTLVEGDQTAGGYTVTWHGSDQSGRAVATGLYFYELTAGTRRFVNKMLYLK